MSLRRTIAAFLAFAAAACAAPADRPASARADYGQSRAALLALLEKTAREGKSLSGQQVNEYEVFIRCTSFERIHELVGAWPAILGLELMFIIENPSYKDYFLARARDHAARGGIVAITWHARNPIRVCPRGEYYRCSQTPMSEEELARLLDPSTKEHALWARDVDAVAGVLKEMQAMGIAPIFRPYHEMNGGWFWWGRKDDFPRLWRMLRERLAETHGLSELVWVWSSDKGSEDAAKYYPGDDYVDVVGADIYTEDRDGPMYETAKSNIAPLHSSGLFAFAEIGLLPNAEIFRSVRPVWFLLWGGEFIDKRWAPEPCALCNEAEDVAAVYALEETLALHEVDWPPAARLDPDSRRAPAAARCPASLL
ncbi:glycosyl hydrolase [Amphiplicatus metriothermophilus]|uniref:Mannan endo-1,4-beta-mannosidase n=1 Tax=Amphiplicatus metriothermophilus TaxID=1519374 RepID=A0A239PYZ3_9PROT|nr:glycosyl hydrolase [Amphiplicatus metriothermophilus]MBB5519988.1 mannan endo-1,4-beta-mannosidase [Amphiplicatus metriothermophilus]SNT74887.1 mannan endo-1,4-beta-mannosidase [Amphiplicatus metriothermophilus]